MIPRALIVLTLLVLLAPAVAGCWEVPPRLPEPVTLPHTPRAVYRSDSFAPENRWFQRVFGERSAEGGFVAEPARPLPSPERLANWEAVDRAELLSLLECVRDDPFASSGRSAVFQSDLLATAALLSTGPDGELYLELGQALLSLAERQRVVPQLSIGSEAATTHEGLAAQLPLELPSVDWKPVVIPLPASLLPRARDLRWTRVFVPGRSVTETPLELAGETTLAVLRLRVGLLSGGEPSLLSIASECRLVSVRGNSMEHERVWHRDRVAWPSERGWREVELSAVTPWENFTEEGRRSDGTIEEQQRRAARVVAAVRARFPLRASAASGDDPARSAPPDPESPLPGEPSR